MFSMTMKLLSCTVQALWLSGRKRKDEAEDAATMLAEARQGLSHSEPLLAADHELG